MQEPINGHSCVDDYLGRDIVGTTQLLTANSAKIEHSNSQSDSHMIMIMYLAPAWLSGKNFCA